MKRVVIKLSGEALSGGGGGAFCERTVGEIARQVKAAHGRGTQIALVVGGGNFWRGRAGAGIDRVKADQIGMLATVMNAIYLGEIFAQQGVKSVVMTPIAVGNMTQLYAKEAALAAMAEGMITFHAAGLGHPYFSTDTVAALRGLELEADCVLFTKNGVGGVYDRHPQLPGARMYKNLPYRTAIAGQLQVADLTALQLLAEAGLPARVFGLGQEDGIARACQAPLETEFGTLLRNQEKEAFYV